MADLQGTRQSETLRGTAEADNFNAGPGNDTIILVGGSDSVRVGRGEDVIVAGGDGDATVNVRGFSSNDKIDLSNLGMNADDITIAQVGNNACVTIDGAEDFIFINSNTSRFSVEDNFVFSGNGSNSNQIEIGPIQFAPAPDENDDTNNESGPIAFRDTF